MITTENLGSDPQNVNLLAPFAPLLTWLAQKGESGELPGPTVSNMSGAVKQLGSVLRSDEPTDVSFALGNLDELAKRWVNKHPGNKGETARTYVGRFKTAGEWFLAWQKDPVNFRFPAAPTRPKREPKAERREAKGNVELQAAPLPANEAAAVPGYKKYPIPLGGGRPDLILQIPEGEELNVDDCFRVLWGMLLHASDFDPRNPQVMAIQRRHGEG